MNGAKTIGYSEAKFFFILIGLLNHTQKLATWTISLNVKFITLKHLE